MGTFNFEKSLAVVIGINQYTNGIAPLRTAMADARAVASLLEREHGYQVLLLLDEEAQLAELKELIHQTLPNLLSANSRLLFYFAGHGIAQDGDDGPAGYLIPQDAAPGNVNSYLSMVSLHDQLTALPCRHFLAIFDCCFAGAFRWSSTRKVTVVSEVIHRERYDRFRQDPAWQVITSASYDQPAMDVLSLRDERGEVVDSQDQQHSPFAAALIQALQGDADLSPPAKNGKPAGDGVITATELYLYLREQVEVLTEGQSLRQTPEICALRNHDKGEYIFLTPGHELNLPPAPELKKENNPYRGLESFDKEHQDLFFGRDTEIERLLKRLDEPHPMVVVLGASGTGKSSLVKAGLLPRVSDNPAFHVLPVMRPGNYPLDALARACVSLGPVDKAKGLSERFAVDETGLSQLIGQWKTTHPKAKLLLVIDQAEELITQASTQAQSIHFQRLVNRAMAEHWQYFRIVATLRLDFEAQFQDDELRDGWMDSRFVIPPMSQAQLREAIEKPAAARVLYFEPSSLIDKLVEDVAQTPGALPLLSFMLSELYLRYLEQRSDNRALTETDYRALGGVSGALTQRATQEYESLVSADDAYRKTVKHVMLRMVALEGGELARRRVPLSELVYADQTENERVQNLLDHLIAARLIVRGQEGEGEPYVEPAHDALVRGWDKLLRWKNIEQVNLGLQRELMPQARNWQEEEKSENSKRAKGFLWDENPRLDLLKSVLASDDNWLNAAEERFVQHSVVRKRNRRTRLVSSMAAAIAVLTVVSGLAILNAQEANRQTKIALLNEQEANRQAKIAQLREQAARILNLLPTPDSVSALVLAIDTMDQSQSLDSVRTTAQISLLNALQVSQEINRLQGHDAEVLSVAFSPDGQRIVSGSKDNTLRLWDTETGDLVAQSLTGHTAEVLSVAFSPDGQRIVSGSWDKTLRIWDAKTLVQIEPPLTGHDAKVSSVAFSPDGQRIVSGSWDKTLRLWDAETGAPIGKTLTGHDAEVSSVAFSPDGQRIVSSSWDKTLRLWDAETLVQSGPPLMGHEDEVWSVAFSPDSRRIVSGSRDRTLRLWDTETGDLGVQPLTGHRDIVWSVAFSPDGQQIVSGSLDQTLRIWNAETGEPIGKPLTGHREAVRSVAFSPDSQRIVSGSWDKTLRIWDIETVGLVGQPLSEHENAVVSIAFSPDGQQIVSGSLDKTLQLRNAETGALFPIGKAFTGHESEIRSVAFRPDGQRIVSGSWDKTLRIWDAETGKPIGKPLTGHKAGVLSVAFSPDGRRIVSGSWDKTLRIWDAKTGAPSGDPLTGHKDPVLSVAFSPDGRRIVSGSWDKTLRIWDAKTGEPIGDPLTEHSDRVLSVAFSSDGQRIVSGSSDNTLRIWNAETLKPIGEPLMGHRDGILSVAFSPDDQWIVSGSRDKTLRLWDAETLVPSGPPLKGHEDVVWSVAFSPDDQRIVSGSLDGTLRSWNPFSSSETLIDLACNRLRAHPLLNEPQTVTTELDFLQVAERSKLVCEQREGS